MVMTAPKTWAVGDVLTAADMNTYVRDNQTAQPWGKLGYTSAGGVAGITATTTLLTQAVTVGTGRRIRIHGNVRFFTSAGTTAAVDLKVQEGGTVLETATSLVNSPTAISLDAFEYSTPSAGAHTYTLVITPFGGSTIATQGSQMYVEDLGAS